jgi:hypothetical protein
MVVACGACAQQQQVEPAQSTSDTFVSMTAPGARVRVKSRSGTFKPAETGHITDVNVTAGKTGVVVQEIGEIVRIRFDAQAWEEFPPNGVTVDLEEFEATIHVSYLERAQ